MIEYEGKQYHEYTIPGEPIPWARPRVGKGMKFFDSQKPMKTNWAISLEYQREGQPYYEDIPLHLIINFYFSTPLNATVKHQNALKGRPYLHRKDLDNLVKFALDASNKVLFDDDCLIYKITASKHYDIKAYTQFALIPLQG